MAVTAVMVVGVAAGCTCTPPAVVDEPASALEAKAVFIDVDEAPPDGKLPVIVQFSRGGTFIQLASSAAVACNGVPLPWNGLGYAERVPLLPAGSVYTISHTRGAITTRISITVPPRPQITAPAAGATVLRATAFAITYAPAGGASVRPGVAGPTGSLSGASQPDTGTATIDASSVGPGPGSVSLTRDVAGTPTIATGTGFASATFTYAITRTQRVVWQ